MSFAIILSATLTIALVNNVVVFQFLGLYQALDIKAETKAKKELVAGVGLLLIGAVLITYLIKELILVPLDIVYLELFIYVLVLLGLTEGLKRLLHHLNDRLIQLPLITANAIVLGLVLIVAGLDISDYSFFGGLLLALFTALGAGLGFGLMVLIFSAIDLRLKSAAIPKNWQGLPLLLIIAGIISMILTGLNGLF